MNTHSPQSVPPTFGLIAWLEDTRVVLPLKGVEARFQVTGAIASVEIDQIYHQDARRPLDCVYVFPLPGGAAVYRCELHVNGRIIRARVEEQTRAREIYRTQKAAGRRTALVETERDNLFTLSLGNVQPGDLVVVRFAWFQVLDRVGAGLRLLVPTCPGVRYIPGRPLLREASGRGTENDTDQVPDASRISPPRIDALHPDAAYFSLKGRLSAAEVEPGSVTSASHPIHVCEEPGGEVSVTLADQGSVPNRDFVLAWREASADRLVSRAWRWTDAGETYVLAQLRAPEFVEIAEDFPQDVYFLADRSGSMEGAKWKKTCEALRSFVGLLGAKDRVAITLFESQFRDFSEAPMPAPRVLLDRGFQRIERLGTDGGTELLPALRHVLEQIGRHSKQRRVTIILITDGAVGNEAEICRVLEGHPDIAVHTFGIDVAVNDAFLKCLAQQQHGGCWLQTPADDIAGTIAALGDRLRRPVLTALAIRGAWESGAGPLPDLHAREVITVPLLGKSPEPLLFSGLLPDGRPHDFAVDLVETNHDAIRLLWARERISTLISNGRDSEAIRCARHFNLICKGTAFVAWDETEHVPIARDEIMQPSLDPDSVKASPSRVFCMAQRVHDDDDPMSAQEYRADLSRIAHQKARDQLAEAELLNERIARIRWILNSEKAPPAAVEAFVCWIRERPIERRELILERELEFLEGIRGALGPYLRDGMMDRCIGQAILGTPDSFLRWVDGMRALEFFIPKIVKALELAMTPEPVVAHLISWVFANGAIDPDRLAALKTFSERLDTQAFSDEARARCWRTFLAATGNETSLEWDDVRRWIDGLERPVEKTEG